jgi:hypothetical protein
MYSIAGYERTWSDANIRKLAFFLTHKCDTDFDLLKTERKGTLSGTRSNLDIPLYLLKIEQPENQDFADLAKRVAKLKADGELFVDDIQDTVFGDTERIGKMDDAD